MARSAHPANTVADTKSSVSNRRRTTFEVCARPTPRMHGVRRIEMRAVLALAIPALSRIAVARQFQLDMSTALNDHPLRVRTREARV
jgi:hypothetical protein